MMNKTVVALFDDIGMARQVVEDLVYADFARSSISLITNDANNRYSRYLDEDYAPREDAVTASEGAGFGAVVGALTGVLVGIAALTIPGIGLAIVAGPIVAGLTGAVAGALTGGAVGALVKSGVPEDEAPYYAEGIRRGGTLISLQTSDTLRAEDIMNRHGSVNIHERINIWRQTGWKGFDSESVETEEIAKPLPVMVTVTPGVRETTPISVVPIMQLEPPIDVDDTVEAVPVIVVANTTDTATPIRQTTLEPALVPVEKERQAE